MMKTLRKTAITIAMAAIACAVFTACGTGNDDGAVQPKEVVATKAVVTTTAEQTEATTTTTTESIVDSEPETTTEATKTTTTTEVIETSEPETEGTTMADNPEGMYPLEECIRRKVEEYTGQKVVSISDIDENMPVIMLENGETAVLIVETGVELDVNNNYLLNKFKKSEGLEIGGVSLVLYLDK